MATTRKLDIGVASYRNPSKLAKTLESIEAMSHTDWHCTIVHNSSPDEESTQAIDVALTAILRNNRFSLVTLEDNVGYAGAVNVHLENSTSEYIAYLDNDVEIHTPGWDERLCSFLDRYHEIGLIFPNGGAYEINRGPYIEVQWAAGFAWIASRLMLSEVGLFDEEIGHQNECDYAMRVRMGGWKCAAVPDVRISHHATATNDPASIERISKGVREFVDKWNRYFNGKNFNYHSTNVTRWEDWPPNALYMEEWWKLQGDLETLNSDPSVITVNGRDYDLIRVPRFKDFYRGRII